MLGIYGALPHPPTLLPCAHMFVHLRVRWTATSGSSTVRRAAHAAHAQESQAARIKSKIRLATFAKVLEIALYTSL